MENTLLKPSGLPFGAIDFTQVRDEDFTPAFDAALEEARRNLKKIREVGQPDFQNTIEALEFSTDRLDAVSSIFSNLLHAHTNERMQEMAKEIMPKLAGFSNDISLDEELFKRVRAVHEGRGKLALSQEQEKLLDKTYRFFVRNGALLDENAKQRLREVDARLSILSQQFGENVLKASNAFELVLTDRNDLAGLPDAVIEAAEATAKERGREGAWVFTLDYPSYLPFMKFSERRELRERIWKAFASRATTGEFNNRELAKEIANLRHERARLLKYETHAHFTLEERMAAAPENVRGFLERLQKASRKAAEKDVEELSRFSGMKDLRPWDFAYWSEKLKQKKYGLDEQALRAYFPLERVVAGVFEHARRLYGLSFKRRTDLPAYHPDVEVYEVSDEKDGEHVGLFYADFFPRASKRGGAWMTSFRDQGFCQGCVLRPHVSIVCNLSKPTPTRPSLLDLQEVRTVFHEFGHALHALLSNTHYRSLSGTNVYWDFVELPSQIMENWLKEKESLDLFARHYETGEAIPEEMVRQIAESSRFQAGWQSLRQVSLALLDLAWHAVDPAVVEDVEEYEKRALEACTLFPHVPGTSTSCSFSHIFAGGYSAGYYSYKWAEVLDADAFELFRERGLFNPEVASAFRNHILSRGGTEHPMELYKRFRGREPDPDALLRRDGLL